MWRSSLGGCVAVLASAVLISACSNDSRNSTEPLPPPVSESIVPTGCPTVTQTAQMIVALYPKGADRLVAAASYAAILLYINTKHQADAQTLMFRLLDYTLQRYNAGKLIGGYLPTTQALLLQFETGLYCTVGLPTTGLVVPGNPADGGSVNKVVFPSTTTQNIVTPNGNAGVQLPPNSFTGPAVLVTIAPLSGKPLNTTLDQYGPFSDVKVSPETALTTSISVGLCLDNGVQIPTVFLAHNISATSIEVLPHGNFISGLCGVTVPPTSLRKVFDLGKNGDLASATKMVGAAVADMLLPTNANATGGGVTGTTRKFSPFGGVDTKVYMTANSPTTQNAPAGSAVPNPPSTIVKTQMGALVAKVNVVFTVTSGGGTVAGGSSSTVATDATGVATVSNWVINAGSNTVQAVGTYADPSVTFAPSTDPNFPQAVTVDPTAGITFTATGGNVVPYGSSYLFQNGVQGHDAGFESPTYSTANWSTGSGPFGSASTACPLNHEQGFTMNTAWTVGNDLTLRTTFPLPKGWSAPLTVTAAIDNDIQVFVNGHDETPNYAFAGNASNYSFNSQTDFVTHENCATKGSLTFSVPIGDLNVGGDNVLAIRARDRGDINYVDAKVAVAPPPVPQ